METNQLPLTDNSTWKKLQISAKASLGKTRSYYEAPEPELFDQLIDELEGNLSAVFEHSLKLIQTKSVSDLNIEASWADLKEAGTLLYHIQKKGFGTTANWEETVDLLWQGIGIIGQGKWSTFPNEKNEAFPLQWKQLKFILDAFFYTIYHLDSDHISRVERFFASNMSDYWKSYFLYKENIWGDFENNSNPYFEKFTYRNNHKKIAYHLLIYRLENNDLEFPVHPNKAEESLTYFIKFKGKIPKIFSIRKKIYLALQDFYSKNLGDIPIEDRFKIIRDILGDNDVFIFLYSTKELSPADRGKLVLQFDDFSSRWENNRRDRRRMLPDLLAALKHNESNVQEKASIFLATHEAELFKHLRYILNIGYDKANNNLENVDLEGVRVFKKIARVLKEETVKKLMDNSLFSTHEKGQLLLATPRRLESSWDSSEYPNHEALLPIILSTVNHQIPGVSKAASQFLKHKSEVLQDRLNELIKDLNQEDKATELISSAIEFGNEASLKAILSKCLNWVASNKNSTLLDRASQKARYIPGAVIALINLLNEKQNFKSDPDVIKYIHLKTIEDQQNPTIKRVFEDGKLSSNEVDSHTISEIYNWCQAQKEISKVYADIVESREESIRQSNNRLKPKPTFELAKALLKELKQKKLAEREISVQKWITQLLGEMSDPWYFEDKQETYEQIKKQLERLAIEPLSKRLPKEEDIDIRENLVKILGNIGGRVAVDALVRTVTGEERERAARQELLSEYYLKPSKARSEEASLLLKDAVHSAKKTMRLLQFLNISTFGLGVLLILGGVVIAVINETLGTRIAGALAGLGGMAAILTQFLKDPLERIQRAMADLVQVQTAFTSFVWELNLNGTYIQSQYVSEGVLTDYDLRQTIGRIDSAMDRTMHSIQVYADGNPERLKPNLISLVPPMSGIGGTFAIFGQSLLGQVSKDKLEVVINGIISEVDIEIWTDQMVMFNLSKPDIRKYQNVPRLWINLLVNNQETNALPYSVDGKKIESPAPIPQELKAKPADQKKN